MISYETIFQKKVFEATQKIPRGKVATYKEIAKKLGDINLARSVGNALNKNRNKSVPCHRVVRSDKSVGGFAWGTKEKIKKLQSEGIKIKNGKVC